MFKELKIIELSSVLAGPSVGMFFAELGSKVIKIENKNTNGDVTRNWKLINETPSNQSAYFSSVNWGKEHIFLDFNNKKDLLQLRELIKAADIIISNFKFNDPEKFSLSYKDCKNINSKIIYAHLGGFRSDLERVAFDVVIQAETGYMSMNGNSKSTPLKIPLAMMDILAAHQLKEGILVALLNQQKSKSSYFVETTLEESAIASLANQASNYLMLGHVPERIGSLHPNIAPYGEIIRSKDDITIVLAIGTDKQFFNFTTILGISKKLLTNYGSNQQRVKNRKPLLSLLNKYALKIKSSTLINECKKLKVPVGEIKNIKEVFESNTAQEMILEEIIEEQKTLRVATIAFRINS